VIVTSVIFYLLCLQPPRGELTKRQPLPAWSKAFIT
jgi:hypothetical protein